jgi:hypothetical protein
MLDTRSPQPDYDLVVTDGRRRFVLFHRDAGVWLGGESVSFMRRGERLTRPLRDIASVSLTTHGLPRIGIVAHCDIHFVSGERVVVTNIFMAAWSRPASAIASPSAPATATRVRLSCSLP